MNLKFDVKDLKKDFLVTFRIPIILKKRLLEKYKNVKFSVIIRKALEEACND